MAYSVYVSEAPTWIQARLVTRLVEVASRIAHEAIEPTEKDPAAVSLLGGRAARRAGELGPSLFLQRNERLSPVKRSRQVEAPHLIILE